VTTEDFYLDGEERFGPVVSFLYGLGSVALNRYYDVIVNDLRGRQFNRLLDVGCGNAVVLGKLAANLQSPQFCGVDPSPHMLSRAKSRLSRKKLNSRVELRIGSSRSIPFEGKFDAIISSFSYHHWKERDKSLLSLISHISDGGFMSIYEHDNSGRRITTSHGIEESEWNDLEIEGVRKTIDHKNGLIILTLAKQSFSSV
jgi:SAM-dependent methyltransferase